MDEKIKDVVRRLKLLSYLFFVVLIVVCTLFELGVLPQYLLKDNTMAQYMCTTIGVLLSIAVIPFSLKLFDLKLAKTDGKDSEHALKSYYKWALIRIAALYIVTLCDVIVYYFVVKSEMFFCALMVFAFTLYCHPSVKRVRRELKIEKEEK